MTKLSYTIPEAAVATGFGEKKIRLAVRAGDLRAKRGAKDKDGEGVGQIVILAGALQSWLEGLADA